jgi:hypothetical protein
MDVARADVVAGDKMDEVAIKAEHVREQTAAKRDGTTHDHLEYRLRVRWHGADQAEHLGCRSLPLARLFLFAGESGYLALQVGDGWG